MNNYVKDDKVQFNTLLSKAVLEEFKYLCKINGLNMNAVIEQFMRDCNRGKIKLQSVAIEVIK